MRHRVTSDDNDDDVTYLLNRSTNLAMRLLGDRDQANEVASEALTRLLEHQDVLDQDNDRRLAWTLRVTRNLAINVLRRHARERTVEETDLQIVDEASEIILRITILEALRDLPQNQRRAITMRYLLDQGQTQVALTMGVQPGTIATHVSRALARLRVTLSDHQPITTNSRMEKTIMNVNSLDEASQLIGTNRPIHTKITAGIQGTGEFTADIGLPAIYRPRAQRRPRWSGHGSPAVILDTEFECVVIDIDEEQRPVVTDALTTDEATTWETRLKKVKDLHVGEQRRGTVAVVLRFGALIDFDGLRGLIPTDDIDPTAPLHDGQPVTVEVVSADTQLGHIRLRLATR